MAVRADGGGGSRMSQGRPKPSPSPSSGRPAKPRSPQAAPNPKVPGAQSYQVPSNYSNPSQERIQNRGSYSAGPADSQPFSVGGGMVGGGGGGGLGGGMGALGVASAEEDYLSGDSGFQAQQSALQSALQRYLADAEFQRSTYDTDYNRSLRDLGYDEDTKAWNWNDRLTAAGNGYQNQLDDFGARGMLQSSGYADAFGELQRLLGQQYDAMSGARGTFMTDLDKQIANYKAENTSNQQAARAEALQRMAAGFAL